ncbi:ABC transporter ATP-binding protein [Roseobacter sp. HKCCA0434]|uniref:ABC transporter ATP-binding protein n=1 Tax=Roseobacter sp. HKCCA0434 TaxID=3079297 RepID=UPI002905A520|nr:ABC transporter ATP-binding protein [Roseobacter sp. HKCCA0434]
MIRRFADLVAPFAAADGDPPQTLFAFLRWALSGMRRVLLVAAIAGLALGVSEAVAAWLVGYVIDLSVEQGAEAFMARNAWLLAGIAAFFLLLRPALVFATSGLNALAITPNAATMAMARLNRHTMGQSLRFFDNDFAGRIAQKQSQTVSAIGSILSEVVNSLAYALSVLAGAMLVLLQVSPRLGIVLGVWFAVYLAYIRFFLPRVRARARARAGARARLSGQLVDVLSNMATVRLFASGRREEAAAEDAMANLREKLIGFGEISVLFRGGLALLAGALPVGLIGVSLLAWQTGQATPGDIAIAGLLSTRLGQMSGWISFVAMGIFANIGEIENGLQTLAPRVALPDGPRPLPLAQVKGRVSFDDVTFHYGQESAEGLNGLTLDIAAGEKVGLVGLSGAGKSTALSLALRLYDVERGAVRLDGIDLRELRQDDLRAAIAMVRQDTSMFNRSAYDNIAYGRPEATPEEVREAARLAQADAFIRDLADPDGRRGYDAHLGERGVRLSGGQRQRIAIARAFLKDAPVLLLDEATAALDSETEAGVQRALEGLMQGRTVVAIAHRLSTLIDMDRIAVLEAGRVVEIGTHQALLERRGRYHDFWQRQTGTFTPTVAEAAAAEGRARRA